MSFITSADSVFILTIKDLFNAPIQLENWASDTAWSSSITKLAETKLSLDGKLNKGFLPAPHQTTLHFSANSDSLIVFDALALASRQARKVFELNGELTLQGLNRKYTFTNGCITEMDMVPSGSTMLGNRNVTILWQDILQAGI